MIIVQSKRILMILLLSLLCHVTWLHRFEKVSRLDQACSPVCGPEVNKQV